MPAIRLWKNLPVSSTVTLQAKTDAGQPISLLLTETTPDGTKPDTPVPIPPGTTTIAVPKKGTYTTNLWITFLDPALTTVTITGYAADQTGTKIRIMAPAVLKGTRPSEDALTLAFNAV